MNRLEKLKEMQHANPGDSFLKFAIALEYVNEDKAEAVRLLEGLLRDVPAYIPTYYQLGKLYEEMNEVKRALEIYQSGIAQAEAAGEMKTARELKEALALLEDEQE